VTPFITLGATDRSVAASTTSDSPHVGNDDVDAEALWEVSPVRIEDHALGDWAPETLPIPQFHFEMLPVLDPQDGLLEERLPGCGLEFCMWLYKLDPSNVWILLFLENADDMWFWLYIQRPTNYWLSLYKRDPDDFWMTLFLQDSKSWRSFVDSHPSRVWPVLFGQDPFRSPICKFLIDSTN
jgi:hypothetical protein